MHILYGDMKFPPVENADEEGLLAIGGDLSTYRLLEAYSKGIFPWYNHDDPICWWSPDPRCVLFPAELHISRSMKKLLRSEQFEFSINNDFEAVMRHCKNIQRKEQDGTWIQDEMIDAYKKLFDLGYALSAECRQDGKLVGGLYGVKLGNVFFGESMFSTVSNSSKFALIMLVQHLQASGTKIIDCQMRTDHLLSLGASLICRKSFNEILAVNINTIY